MLGHSPFYHAIIKSAIIGFGTVFNDIKIERKDANGDVAQTLQIPIAYAPKEKWLVRIEQEPNFNEQLYTILPKMSYEVIDFSYDSTRKLNRVNNIVKEDGDSAQTVYAPVPYNINMALYVLTKTQEDALQIVEQILPFFSPEYTIAVRLLDAPEQIVNIPIVLNDVSFEDSYDGDFQERRFVTYTLNFTLKLNLYGPASVGGKVNTVIVNLTDQENTYTLIGDALTKTIISAEWSDP